MLRFCKGNRGETNKTTGWYGKNTGFLIGFLEFGICLGRIVLYFGGIWGVMFGGFLAAFFYIVFNPALEVWGEVF